MTRPTTITERLEGEAGSDAGPLRQTLVLVHGPHPARLGERLRVPQRGTTELGRSSPAFDAGPLDDPRMSSRHALITPTPSGGVTVEDAGSKNGIVVQGKRVEAAELHPGEVVQLGRTFLMLRVEPAFEWRQGDSRLTGVSFLAHALRQGIARAAAHTLPALVVGESGVGKEPTAREIHRLSGRGGAFVPVNCAALPAELVESELFGHVAGAFSGAAGAREGLLRRADRGTVFLDELGAMPMELQPKLLRAIQERAVRPVGASREAVIDVRFVAATNESIVDLVRSGRLREDLYGRLSGSLITVPPLAERREDIGALVHRFLGGAGRAHLDLAPELVWELLLHPWPLNVRALEQLVLAASAVADGVLGLTAEVRALLDMQRTLREPGVRTARVRAAPSGDELEALLRRHDGVIAQVAAELGVHRFQVYRWLAAAGLDAADFRGR